MEPKASWKHDAETWRREYEEAGYVVVENAIDAATLSRLRDGLEEIEHSFNSGALPPHMRHWITTDRDRTRGLKTGEVASDSITNIMELPLFGAAFRDFIIYPRVLDVLEALFETPEFSFHNLKCIAKMPGNKAGFQWHRDLPYLKHTSPNLLTCMACIDDMTAQNGGTVVCPGSHKNAPPEARDGDTDISESDVPQTRVTVECPAGSIVLFHVNLVHGGGPNRSESKRRNVISIWAGPDAYPTTPARYAYHFVAPRSHDAHRRRQIEQTFDTNAFPNA